MSKTKYMYWNQEKYHISWSNPLLSNMSTDLEGKIILFEEVLFCSDILKNELSPYNVNLSAHLNCTALSSVEFEKVLPIIKKYTRRLQRSESC
jgi:hypothetical protein